MSDACLLALLCLSKETVKSIFSSERVNRFQEVHKPIPKHRLQQKMKKEKKKKKNMYQNDSFKNSGNTLLVLACERGKERRVHVRVKQLSHLFYQLKDVKSEGWKFLQQIGIGD